MTEMQRMPLPPESSQAERRRELIRLEDRVGVIVSVHHDYAMVAPYLPPDGGVVGTSERRRELISRIAELLPRMRTEAFAECSLAEAVEGALRDAADLLREEGEPQKIAALTERASRLEDAAFHFQTCRRCRADGEFGRSTCLDGQMFDAFLRGEARVDSVPLRVVVNGQPVEVQPGSVREVIRQAIEKSGQIGAPIEQWELRTREGETIPHSLEDGWELAGGKLLFLNLGLPASRVDVREEGEQRTLNINDHVWVRLREKGKAMLREQDARWSQLYATTYGRLPVAERQEAENGGWSRWQLWGLIEVFGPALYWELYT